MPQLIASSQGHALLVIEAANPTNAGDKLRPCPLGAYGDHSDKARALRRAVSLARTRLNGGLEVAHFLNEHCFFLSLTTRYDTTKGQMEQEYSLSDLTLYLEHFITILRRGGGKGNTAKRNKFFQPGEQGFEFEYSRSAEWTERGIVNHFHMIFRVRKMAPSWVVKTRWGKGISWRKLREVWEYVSHGSIGVWIEAVNVKSASARASAVRYLTKYVAKRVGGNKMRFSTSRDWLPPGGMKQYNDYFHELAIKYKADCLQFHTDASRVYMPWVRWLDAHKDDKRMKVKRHRKPKGVVDIMVSQGIKCWTRGCGFVCRFESDMAAHVKTHWKTANFEDMVRSVSAKLESRFQNFNY